MAKRTLNDEILEVLQIIGGVFVSRGIPAIPVNLDYLETKMAPDMEKIVVKDLIKELFNLMNEYKKQERKPHKYENYIKRFYDILEDNTHDNKIITRKTA